MMSSDISVYCAGLITEFGTIPQERKLLLERISNYVSAKLAAGEPSNLIYICTHNSRRSLFGQIWARVAAGYYKIKNVHVFSGGTEETAFHINAIHAIKRIGFDVKPVNTEENTLYHVSFDEKENPVVCFSKTYDNPSNPKKGFAAIMTCSDADENCPFIPGNELRVGTTYDDPKAFDNTPQQDEKYDERCRQIARETLYVFSLIN